MAGKIDKKYTNVDEYITAFSGETQEILRNIREVVNKAAPGSDEAISYGIPALKLNGKPVVYFAGYPHHVSVYPVPHTPGTLQAELAPYHKSKGTLQFPLGEPVPYALIANVAAALFQEAVDRQQSQGA